MGTYSERRYSFIKTMESLDVKPEVIHSKTCLLPLEKGYSIEIYPQKHPISSKSPEIVFHLDFYDGINGPITMQSVILQRPSVDSANTAMAFLIDYYKNLLDEGLDNWNSVCEKTCRTPKY